MTQCQRGAQKNSEKIYLLMVEGSNRGIVLRQFRTIENLNLFISHFEVSTHVCRYPAWLLNIYNLATLPIIVSILKTYPNPFDIDRSHVKIHLSLKTTLQLHILRRKNRGFLGFPVKTSSSINQQYGWY